MEARRRVEVQLHSLLTSAFEGGEWSPSRPRRFNPKKKTKLTEQEAEAGGKKIELDVLDSRKISCSCQKPNPGSLSPKPGHYTYIMVCTIFTHLMTVPCMTTRYHFTVWQRLTLVPLHALKASEASRGIASVILNLGIRLR